METILLPGLWFTNFDLGKKKKTTTTEIVNYENFFMLYLVGKALIMLKKMGVL